MKNRADVKQPSQWLTEIYIPIKQQTNQVISPSLVNATPIE
ncbi:hypothetical protein [Flavobacterium piscinae]|nr:hypothetical protein [Flavobacterium piscinae]